MSGQIVKRYLPAILWLSIVGNVFPQSHQTALKAGINVNDLGGKEAGIYNSLGFHAGMQYEYIFSNNFSVQPELLFSVQGGTLEQSTQSKLNYYYLNLPVMAKVYLIEKIFLEAGPQVGYLLSAVNTDDFGRVNISDNVKRTDFSLAFGFGYKHRNKTSLSARYCLGFSDTIERGMIFQQRLSNRVLQVSIGFVL